MNGVLIDESPLMFQPSLACRVGVNEAIFLQQLHYWIGVNRKQKRNLRDGRYWVYNTLERWLEQFPFWSESTLKRVIKSLKDQGVILTGFFNDDRRDRTAWYSIDYCRLEDKSTNPLGQNDPIRSGQNDLMGQVKMTGSSIQETNNTEITTETSEGRARGKDRIDLFLFVDCYNQHKPDSFARLTIVNYQRRKKLEQLAKDCGGVDNALVALANALRYAKADEWYRGKDLSFDNFASNGKILQLHERWVERESIGAPLGASNSDVEKARLIAEFTSALQ